MAYAKEGFEMRLKLEGEWTTPDGQNDYPKLIELVPQMELKKVRDIDAC